MPAEPLPELRHRGGLRRSTASGSARCTTGRWSAVSWPVEYGGRGADYIHWLIFEEEYYRAGAPGRVNQNGIFLLGPTIMEVGTDGAEGALPADDGVERDRLGAGVERAQRRQRHRRDPLEGASPTTATTWVLNGQKIWASAAPCGPTGASASSAPTPTPSATAASRSSSARSTRPASPCARSPSSTATPASPRSSSTTCACRSRTRSARSNQGWRVAMATAGFERGVSLRSPARFSAAADRLVDALARARRPGRHRAARRGHRRLDAGRGLPAAHLPDRHAACSRAAPIGAEASLNKIFWSEMDVRIHELALDMLGPEAERMDGAAERWVDGFLFSLSGPIYAGTNEIQRNIIADRVLQLPQGLRDAVLVHRRPAAVRRRVCATCSPRSARPRTSAPRGTTAPATTPRCGRHLDGDGRARRARARGRRRARRHRGRRSCCCSRSSAGPPCPARCIEHDAVVAPACSADAPASTASIVTAAARRIAVRAARARVADVVLDPRRRRCDRVRRAPTVDAHRRRAPPASPSSGGTATPVDFDAGARVRPAARSAAAAYLVGLGERMIEIAAEYARQRDQFGQPIGVVPGGQAPAGRRAAEGRVRQGPRCTAPRGAIADGRPDRARRDVVDGQGARQRRRVPRRAAARCRCTARSATRGRPTCSSG